MSRQGEYSDKYNFCVSSISFNMGGTAPSKSAHGTLKTDGIDGAQPKRFTAERHNVPEASTSGPDTAGRNAWKPPSEPRNPLNPIYKLPVVKELAVEPPKFIRDSINVADIEGTKSKPCTREKQSNSSSSNLDTSDIAGASANWKANRQIKRLSVSTNKPSISLPRPDRLDVSDIVGTKTQHHGQRHKPPAPLPSAIDAANVGTIQSREWQQQLNSSRRQCATENSDRKANADAVISAIPADAASTAFPDLAMTFKHMDREGSGKLHPTEVASVLKKKAGLGLKVEQVKHIVDGYTSEKDGGLIDYKNLLSSVYYKSADQSKISKPEWVVARERRVKTDVAVALSQQPTSVTSQELANIKTPNERAQEARPKYGKRIEGLEFPGSSNSGGNAGEAYWFAEFATTKEGSASANPRTGPAPTPALVHSGGVAIVKREGMCAGDPGNANAYWFGDNGEKDQAKKEMATWRPTHDAAFVNDTNKAKKGVQRKHRTMDAAAAVKGRTRAAVDAPPPAGAAPCQQATAAVTHESHPPPVQHQQVVEAVEHVPQVAALPVPSLQQQQAATGLQSNYAESVWPTETTKSSREPKIDPVMAPPPGIVEAWAPPPVAAPAAIENAAPPPVHFTAPAAVMNETVNTLPDPPPTLS